MSDYPHWACLGALCEFLPLAENRVTLADETDRNGMPVARFSYSQCSNDRQLMAAARQVMEQILTAAGAAEVITINRYAHLVGGARMAPGRTLGGGRPRLPQFRRTEPDGDRRQRAAYPGQRQPGPDHHGAGGPHGRRPQHKAPAAAS